MFKLIVNGNKIWEGTSLIEMIRTMWMECKPQDRVEVYQKARTTWYLRDGGIYPFGVK